MVLMGHLHTHVVADRGSRGALFVRQSCGTDGSGVAGAVRIWAGFVVDQGGDCRMAAEPGQAAAAGGPNAADRDAQPGADLGVRHGRVRDKQGNQLLAALRQIGECLAQRSVAFCQQQLILGPPALGVWDGRGIWHRAGSARIPCCARGPAAFVPGRGGEPAPKRGRFADVMKLAYKPQPDALANVVGIGTAELVAAADGPDQRRVPIHKCVPRLGVAVSGAPYQVGCRRVIGHRDRVLSGRARLWMRPNGQIRYLFGPAGLTEGRYVCFSCGSV
jgi:hypothetical protein